MVSDLTKLNTFQQLIEKETALFTDRLDALSALADELKSKNSDEEQAALVEAWLKDESHAAILKAYRNALKKASNPLFGSSGEKLGFGGKSSTKPNQPSQSLPELIEQVVKQNSPIAKKEPEKPEKS